MNTITTKHSPLPWMVEDASEHGCAFITTNDTRQDIVVRVNLTSTTGEPELNDLKFIVQACNHFEQVTAQRDLWQTKAENWERLATTKLQVEKDLTAQRDELQAEVMRLDGELLDVRGRNDELLTAAKGAIAALSQPVQDSKSQDSTSAHILRCDCSVARKFLYDAISKSEQH